MDNITEEASRAARRIEPIMLTVPEACLMLRISRSMLYQLIRAGKLETVRLGRRRYVHSASIRQLVDQLKEREGGGDTQQTRQW